MTPELWGRVEALWEKAATLSGEARARFVEAITDTELRRELASLLAHAGDEDFLAESVIAQETVPDPVLDRQLGPYRVLEQIGEGGMSRVYRAHRTDDRFEKEVAVKVLRGADPHLVRRFFAERRILATFEHPNIARLLDAGSTSHGQPYVVMEFVKGEPITTYCERRQLGITPRIQLFRRLCAAVDVAHRHLIVHRDLKPSNVLVTDEGELKLLDFGIAKLLDDGSREGEATVTLMRALTPGYASPEHKHGTPITTVSDVYSLGIVLFELLTAVRPDTLVQAAEHESEIGSTTPIPTPSAAVRAADAERLGASPARRAQQLRGDLDVIVGKAIEHDPADRYPSARALSDDLGRHLRGLPIEARAPDLAYRSRKLLARHPIAVPLVAGLLAAIIGLAIFASILAHQRLRERDEARRQRARAEQVSQFLEGVFRAADPTHGGGDQIRARDIVDGETERVTRELAEQPALRGRFLNTLAVVYQNLGLFDDAERTFAQALADRRTAHGDAHPEVAESLADLAWMLSEQSAYDQAMAHIDEALSILDRLGDGDTSLRAHTLERRGKVQVGLGRYEAAETSQRAALDIRRRLLGDTHELVGHSWRNLAESVSYQGRYREAIDLVDRALPIAEASHGADSAPFADALHVKGDQQFLLEDFDGAVATYDTALAIYRQRVSANHPTVAIVLNNRARALRYLGDLAEAETSYRRALEVIHTVFGPEHREAATIETNLAQVLRNRGRFAEAIETARRGEAGIRRLLGDQAAVGFSANGLGAVLRDAGLMEEAVTTLEGAVAIVARHLGDDHPSLAYVLANLGRTLVQQGKPDEAESHLAHALRIVDAQAEAFGPQATARLDMGDCRRTQGALDDAIDWYRQAVRTLGPDGSPYEVAKAWRKLAETELLRDRPAEAHRAIERARGALRTTPPAPAWQQAEIDVVETAIMFANEPSSTQVFARFDRAIEVLRTARGPEGPATRDAVALAIRTTADLDDPRAARYHRTWETIEETRAALRNGSSSP